MRAGKENVLSCAHLGVLHQNLKVCVDIFF